VAKEAFGKEFGFSEAKTLTINLDFIPFYEAHNPTLKPLRDGSFSFCT
jgi:hypothetical protein